MFFKAIKLATCLLACLCALAPAPAAPAPERPAPDFELCDLEGRTWTLNQFKGNVVVIDFWATWCGPCRIAIPELVELQNRYRAQGLTIIGISMDDPERVPDAKLKAFAQKHKINYLTLRGEGTVWRSYFPTGNTALPFCFIIDRQGTIRGTRPGFRKGALEQDLAPFFN